MWIAYALATDQYGFIVSAIAYAAVYIKSYRHWRRDEQEDKKNDDFYATQITFE